MGEGGRQREDGRGRMEEDTDEFRDIYVVSNLCIAFRHVDTSNAIKVYVLQKTN
jgi:hypothetical protein